MVEPSSISSDPLACSTLAWTYLGLGDALQQIADLGFTQFELVVRGDGVWPGHVDPARLADDPSYATELTDSIAQSGLRCISAGVEHAKTISLVDECRRMQAVVDLIAPLGARVITAFVYDVPEAAQRWQALRAIVEAAGMTLAAETHLGSATQDPKRAIELAAAFNLDITLDASHYIGQGYVPTDWAALCPRVKAVQLRYCVKGNLQEPTDDIDDATISQRFAQLIPAGYTGPIICEQIANPKDPIWFDQIARTRGLLLRSLSH